VKLTSCGLNEVDHVWIDDTIVNLVTIRNQANKQWKPGGVIQSTGGSELEWLLTAYA
jgi:hypothetical protein